ncbi:beta-ketoacyl-ACP synthase 3 [Brachybacterium sp. AOP25-B2-12]|uniref:beta-ketoacyl-ACP synthase 3 n=1 Tax=Brachybacterium sp. AOP25-B2-12 TaxID=3457710 RepID=UPI004033CD65
MKTSAPRGSALLGLGHFQPEKTLTNDDISQLVETSDEWIRTRTGIRERHVVTEDDTVLSMATAAARMALADAGVGTVDLVIVASTTTTHRSPSTAARVAFEVGSAGAGAFDMNSACSGFEYALGVADQAIRAGSAETALVVGAEALTRFTDWTDRSTCVLTADGAGAVVLGAAEEPHVSTSVWGSVPGLTEAVRIDGDPQLFTQDGRKIMRWALTEAADRARDVLAAADVSIDDIEVLAFHQANLRIIEPLVSALGGEDKIVITDVELSGNTSAASVPLGLSKAWHRGDLPRGARTLLFGFGGGFSYAGQVVDLPA